MYVRNMSHATERHLKSVIKVMTDSKTDSRRFWNFVLQDHKKLLDEESCKTLDDIHHFLNTTDIKIGFGSFFRVCFMSMSSISSLN